MSLSLIADTIAGITNVIPPETPPRFQEAIRHCWFFDPKERPTSRNLANYLADDEGRVALVSGGGR